MNIPTIVRAELDALAVRAAEFRTVADSITETSVDDAVPALDRGLRDMYERLDSARRFLTLFRPPVHALYDPIEAARAQSAHLVGPSLAALRGRQFLGDADQVRECLRLIVDNSQLAEGGSISLEIHVESDPPCVIASLNPAAQLPANLTLHGPFTLSLPEFAERWNAATAGGRVEALCSGLRMNLRGTRRPPEPYPWAVTVLEPTTRLVRLLMPWRGAIGNYEAGVAHDEARTLYRQTLEKAMSLLRDAMEDIPAAP